MMFLPTVLEFLHGAFSLCSYTVLLPVVRVLLRSALTQCCYIL